MSKVLIIDDDDGVCRTLEIVIKRHGHTAVSALSLAEGMACIASQAVDLVLLDVHLPDGNGLEKIPAISQCASHPEIIIITGQGEPDGAELAIRSGAWDYLEKASSPKSMAAKCLCALEYRAGKKDLPSGKPLDRQGIIGSSQALGSALEQLAQTVGSDGSVLITGETGTGKELFAQAIHRNSNRKDAVLVVVDCAALPQTLVESMLFGHVKGAYTGADGSRDGLIMQADGGTLFLDEVGEMPLDLQKAFLRVLESHRFRPIGGKQELSSNFRLISSTNRDLAAMVRQGRFRKDLLYRLQTFHLELPPLRARREDIKELAHYHIDRLCALYGLKPRKAPADVLEILEAYDWPGNVRELVHTIDHALAGARNDAGLYACHLPRELRAQVARKNLNRQVPPVEAAAGAVPPRQSLPPLQIFREEAVEKAENNYLQALMTATHGSMAKACSLSGVSRSRLYELLKKHAISPN